MESEYRLEKGKLIIMVPRELDHHQAGQLGAEADLLIDTYHIRHLVFDFSNTEFMDSSGIGVIIGRYRNLNFAGGDVSAQNLSDRVEKIFQVSGLKKIIQIRKGDGTENE